MYRKFLKFALCGVVAMLTLSCGNKTKDPNVVEEVSEATAGETGNAVTENVMDNPNFKIVDNIIYSENLPVVVDFYATWCGPCKQYSPTFHQIAEKYAGTAVFVSIDVDQYEDIAAAYHVQSIPTTVFILPGGGVLGVETGVIPAETLESYMNQLLANNEGANLSL